MTKDTKARELIWTFIGGNLCVLVPKQRGKGYLMQPYGHHYDAGLEEIRSLLNDVDIFGLDGHLEFQLNSCLDVECVPSFALRAVDLLETHYGFPARESNTDFWINHPVPRWRENHG